MERKKNRPPAWRATVISVGRVLEEGSEFAISVSFTGRQLTQQGPPDAPSRQSPTVFLTGLQARELLLLVAHALGLPGTGIEQKLPKPH